MRKPFISRSSLSVMFAPGLQNRLQSEDARRQPSQLLSLCLAIIVTR